jgi:hypothetical protein
MQGRPAKHPVVVRKPMGSSMIARRCGERMVFNGAELEWIILLWKDGSKRRLTGDVENGVCFFNIGPCHSYVHQIDQQRQRTFYHGVFSTDVRDEMSILLREPLLLKRSVRRSTQTETWIPRNARIYRALLRLEVM